jgi:sugar lactone lactonase YvrE
MGLWTDRAGNVYVADASGGKAKRIDPKGKVTIVAESSYPWSPSGGTFDRQGNLWLLEFNVTNDVRVRKVTPLLRGDEGRVLRDLIDDRAVGGHPAVAARH